MKRWDDRLSKMNKEIENKKVDNFLEDIIKICKKHNLSISHEDNGGSFIIEDYDIELSQWLLAASISRYCKTI